MNEANETEAALETTPLKNMRLGLLRYLRGRIEGRLGGRYAAERADLDRQINALTPQDAAALAWVRTSGEFTLENAIATDRFAGVERLRPESRT